jgi:hypothetical protein
MGLMVGSMPISYHKKIKKIKYFKGRISMISNIQPHLFLTATAWRSWRLYQNEKEWQQFIKGPAGKEA